MAEDTSSGRIRIGTLTSNFVFDYTHDAPGSHGKGCGDVLHSMNLLSTAVLSLGYFLIFLIRSRTVKRRRAIILVVLLLPMIFFSARWANYRGTWLELIVAIGAACGFFALWWFSIGRTLAPPKGSSIRVWSKDDPFE
jgi:hypothetical protein